MAMQLPGEDIQLFFRLQRGVMCFLNERRQLVPGIRTPEDAVELSAEERAELRKPFFEGASFLEEYVAKNPYGLSPDDLEIVSTWRHCVAGNFFLFRYLRQHAIFLKPDNDVSTAYGVVALSEPFEDLVGPYLPVYTETVLLPFRDRIVYDGILSSYSISFGPGIRRGLNEGYKAAKAGLGIVTSLPITEPSPGAPQPARRKRVAASRPSAQVAGELGRETADLTDEFCRARLNDEYAETCRNLVQKLARKRPSPLLKGEPRTWACAVVRVIGWVNFLDDRGSKPHLKLRDIDRAFGVSESTAQGKALLIRRMLKIQQFDLNWTLPSRMDDNPRVWQLEVNGFILDARYCPRDIQEEAFRRGLIPYIPAERK